MVELDFMPLQQAVISFRGPLPCRKSAAPTQPFSMPSRK
jgi:hypothetical protein